MGIFDWLSGKWDAVHVAEDRIWLTRAAKFAGIQREVASALADPRGPDAVFLVAHFDDCLDELRSLASRARFDERRVLVTCSKELEGRSAAGRVDKSRTILIVVGERHPLPSHDDRLLDFARSLACRCRFVQHISLEDRLLKVFAGDWVQGVLRQLGMEEDQPIESRMVGRRIRSAQEKIERQATGDAPARSAQEWMEKNCPNLA
ncbi:MAG: hypothetical protein NUV77_14225 [Thermoguttaceae bacterium]|jgi:hypothetical protein|nr:hypothetical protein [Thermoguttaceae bacterium]